MANAESDKKIRQLAIVLSSLERAAAQRVLSSLPANTATRIRQTIGRLGRVTQAERDHAFEALRPILQLSGMDSVRSTANPTSPKRSDTVEQSPAEQILAEGYEEQDFAEFKHSGTTSTYSQASTKPDVSTSLEASKKTDSLVAWYDADSKTWAELLEVERPILIATVLAHAPGKLASEILQELPSKVAVNTLAAMPMIGHTELEIYKEIANQLNERLANSLDRSPAGGWGLNRAKTIFESLPASMRKQWVSQLREIDNTLAAEFSDAALEDIETEPTVAPNETISSTSVVASPTSPRDQIKIAEHTIEESSTYGFKQSTGDAQANLVAYDAEDFESLLQLSKPNLARVIRTCDPETVLLALAGATRNWMNKFEKLIDAREVPRLRARLQEYEDRSLAEIDQAQASIVQAAADLGLFTISGSDLIAA